MATFLKKETRQTKELNKSKPVLDSKRKVVFVNGSKLKRAEEIVALILGTKAPQKQEDIERKEHYSRQLAANGVAVNDVDAIPALYELLGGLVRTPSEQKEADAKAEEARKKGKKRMIE
jgi:hypothetical protein